MAYNSNNQVVTIVDIFDKNSRGDKIQISKIESNGKNSVDIRNMFTSGVGEVLPTQKGVRIQEDMMLDVLKSMVKAIDKSILHDLSEYIESIL